MIEWGKWDETSSEGETYFERLKKNCDDKELLGQVKNFLEKKQEYIQKQKEADEKKLAAEFAKSARIQADMLALAQTLPQVKIKQKR